MPKSPVCAVRWWSPKKENSPKQRWGKAKVSWRTFYRLCLCASIPTKTVFSLVELTFVLQIKLAICRANSDQIFILNHFSNSDLAFSWNSKPFAVKSKHWIEANSENEPFLKLSDCFCSNTKTVCFRLILFEVYNKHSEQRFSRITVRGICEGGEHPSRLLNWNTDFQI